MSRIFIYQLFVRTFGNKNKTPKFNGSLQENGTGTFEDIDGELIAHLHSLNINTVWLTGVVRHATKEQLPLVPGKGGQHPDVVKGIAGSPYAITDYYDVMPYLAKDHTKAKESFLNCVKRLHDGGFKVLIDLVPNHLARQYKSKEKPKGVADFGENDNTSKAFDFDNDFYYLPNERFVVPEKGGESTYIEFPAKATGNDVYSAKPSKDDWYETVKLNYGVNPKTRQWEGRTPVWQKVVDIIKYWLNLGVDGFRCDMVEMVPVDFWMWAIPEVRKTYPQAIFVGEAYNENNYGPYLKAGFNNLYDKVGFYNFIEDVMRGKPEGKINRADEAITRDWIYQDHLLRFWENHDEQRISSKNFAGDDRKHLPAMTFALLSNRNPAMLYAGQEFGEKAVGAEGFSGDDGRTSIFDFTSIPSIQAWRERKLSATQQILLKQYQDLGNLFTRFPVFEKGTYYSAQNLFQANYPEKSRTLIHAFFRVLEEEVFLVITNFSANAANFELTITPQIMKDVQFTGLNIKPALLLSNELSNKSKKLGFTKLADGFKLDINLSAFDAQVISLKDKKKG